MKDFESNLLKLIENIQFRTVSDKFLNKLNEDINKIQSSDKLFFYSKKSALFSKNSVILKYFWVKLHQKCHFLMIPDAALKF